MLRGRIYNRRKKAVPNPEGAGGKSGKIVKAQNELHQTTAEQVSDETGVSPATIKRDGRLAAEVDADPELHVLSVLRGHIYNRRKKAQGGDHGNQYVAKAQNDTLPTAEQVAAETGVSPATGEV